MDALDKRVGRWSDQCVRRPVTAVLLVIAAGCLPVATASAADLRVRDRLTWSHPDGTPLSFRPEVRVKIGRAHV